MWGDDATLLSRVYPVLPMSALNASCCHPHAHIPPPGSRPASGLRCAGVAEGDECRQYVRSVFQEPLAFVIFPDKAFWAWAWGRDRQLPRSSKLVAASRALARR